jgi:hypothetical protein
MVTFLFGNCKKYHYETTCEGTVIDFTTSEPITGATVFLGRAVSNFSGTDYETIATLKTGSDGKFNFKFMAEKSGNYFVLAKGVDWYFDNEIHERVEIEKGKKASKHQKNTQIMMKPKGILKLRVKKTNTSYYQLYAIFEQNIDLFYAIGTSVDTFTVFKNNILGNTDNEIIGTIKKYDASYNIVYDQKETYQIFCKAKDTTYYTLNY